MKTGYVIKLKNKYYYNPDWENDGASYRLVDKIEEATILNSKNEVLGFFNHIEDDTYIYQYSILEIEYNIVVVKHYSVVVELKEEE